MATTNNDNRIKAMMDDSVTQHGRNRDNQQKEDASETGEMTGCNQWQK